ncbi:cache domain-containing protein [Pluralibacter gergoviae]|uniref:cache domain-containing protein n=1 Tax=Pluralibacter gergoviae TaxID=61647 RepID=UPI00155E57F6|nr:cache domain-containing protein [Pluralibacter gergoviae]
MSSPDAIRAIISKIEDITRTIVNATVLLAQEIEQTAAGQAECAPDMFLQSAVKNYLRRHIKTVLSQTDYCSGAGFASHINSTSYWLLEWWYRREGGDEQASLELDQATQQRLDFRTFAWFSQPPGEGKAWIHGPYVDYICNTAYTLTCAAPVSVRGVFLGVAAVDILVSRLEQELLACADAPAVVLTNHEGRIIVTTCPRRRIGDLLETDPPAPLFHNSYFRLYAA